MEDSRLLEAGEALHLLDRPRKGRVLSDHPVSCILTISFPICATSHSDILVRLTLRKASHLWQVLD